MLSHRISSFCDFGKSISDAVTTTTKDVSVRRRMEVPGSNAMTIVTPIHRVNSTNAGVSSDASPRMLSRTIKVRVSTASAANAA